jgi:hypothetical protein
VQQSTSRSFVRRAAAVTLSGLLLAGLFAPATAAAGPGTPPSLVNDNITTDENVAANGNVLANDSNPGEGTLVVTGFTAIPGSVGTLTIGADGAYTFTPASGFTGTHTTDYTAENAKHARTAQILITVNDVPHPPVANDDDVTVTEDTETNVTSQVLANDTDADNDTLSVSAAGSASGGSVNLASGVLTFSPNADVCGNNAGSFDYTVSDGNGGTDTGSATVDITCVNDDPVANDDDVNGTEDNDVVIDVADLLDNDTDVELDTLTVTGVDGADGGSVSLDGDEVTFTPDGDVCGEAGFDYQISDGNGGTAEAHVTIDLECTADAPVANDDDINVDEDTATDVTDAILANDEDPDGDELTVVDVAGAINGDVTLVDGVVTFDPDSDYCSGATGRFDYTISDGDTTSTARATVTIDCVNDDPIAQPDTAAGTEDEDVVIDAADLLDNDSDIDLDTLTVDSVDNAEGGSVALDGDQVTFTPDQDVCGDGAGSFEYTISDGNGGTATAKVTIDLECTNDDPTAGDDTASGTEDEDVVIDAADLLTNDDDIDGDTLSVSAVGEADGGSVVLDGTEITFTPTADLCGDGAASFEYTLSDGNGGTATGTVTIDLECVNDKPVAGPDSASGTEDEDVVIDAADLLDNDSDVDEDTLSVTAVDNADGGTVTLDEGEITFTPDADLCGDGAASFEYTLSDGEGGTATGTVTIDLECVNDAPVAVDDTATIDENSAAADHDVLDNDTDVDEDTLTLKSVDVDPAEGTATIVGNQVHFTPAADFSGTATVTYVVTDGELDDTGELVITVNAVGPGDTTPPTATAPVVAFSSGRVAQAAPLTISWSATDTSGISEYEVQVSINGNAFQPVYKGTATFVNAKFPFKRSLVFRVRATDGEGNTSDWVTAASRKVTAFQSGGSRVVYTGTWRKSVDRRASGAGYSVTTVKGSSVKLTFRGRSVLYVAQKGRDYGRVLVSVDGQSLGRFNLARRPAQFGVIVARATWSGNGQHRIRIVSDTNGKRVTFDTFLVLK